MIVAPTMPSASTTASWRSWPGAPGTRPAATARQSGGVIATCATKQNAIVAISASTIASIWRTPLPCRPSTITVSSAVSTMPHASGTPSSSLNASAQPSTSAMSQAMIETSAVSHCTTRPNGP